MPKTLSVVMAGALAIVAFGVPAQDAKPENGHGHRGQAMTNYFNVAVPTHDLDIILARPEDHSITVSVLAYRVTAGSIRYGKQRDALTNQTPRIDMPIGAPAVFTLGKLSPDTQYYADFLGQSGPALNTNTTAFEFHTARRPGSTFTFTMTADAHLDEHTSAEVYEQSLANIRAEQPDFHIDLGNLFMTDKHATRDEAARQYLAQRFYLGQTGSSVPLFLALGVHDGESSRYDDGSTDSLAVWSNLLRKRYFPNPVPDGFYSGNATPKPPSGLLENYYAWEWGDALFVVLDPYRCSLRQRGGDGWAWSLGRVQYDWLAQAIATSRAKYKFIFTHNLLAGDQASRGGVEIAGFNEWGGRNLDGTAGFAQHRPGWPMPVHQLLRQNHVTAVFKAHDNFYARQELDGVLYLMVPQPSFAGNDRIRNLENYGYKHGVFIGNSGYVWVSVSPTNVTVQYHKTDPTNNVADTHSLVPR